jgi:hypothetical protein
VNLAYVITAHRSPRQFARLLRAIHVPQNTYVLHVDAKADAGVHEVARQFAAEHRNAAVIPPEAIIWGSWRLSRAQVRGLAKALEVSRDWAYCLNLTAQDYPLKTQAQIAATLASGPSGANYLEVLDFDNASPGPRKRLEHYWLPFRGQMRKLSLFRRPPPKFKVYWGSNYFNLTRAACGHLVRSDVSRRMQRTFRLTRCADEMIFQNAIMHGPPELRDSVVNKTFRQLTWTGGAHPKTYTMTDLDELVASDAFFARKFDMDADAKVLDALDAHLARNAVAPVAAT